MNTFTHKVIRSLLALVVAISALALTGSRASAATQSIPLCAVAGTATLTGTVTVPIWGFAINMGDCSTVTPTLPGPLLDVNYLDDVTIQLTNAITGHTASFELPGLAVDSACTPDPGAVCYHFVASRPGSFSYHSPGDSGRQMAMGLYGALIVRSSVAGQAYGTSATAYDVESTLVLSQVDPLFNAAPDTFDMNNYLATYWLINGKAYPDTTPIAATAGQKVLLRYVNAGYDNTTMALLGMHERVLARDAHLLNNPFDANAETIPAGGTEDAIVTVPAGGAPSANGFALYNRQLHDGMMTFIVP